MSFGRGLPGSLVPVLSKGRWRGMKGYPRSLVPEGYLWTAYRRSPNRIGVDQLGRYRVSSPPSTRKGYARGGAPLAAPHRTLTWISPLYLTLTLPCFFSWILASLSGFRVMARMTYCLSFNMALTTAPPC